MAIHKIQDQVPENVHELPIRASVRFEMGLDDQQKIERLLVHFNSWVSTVSGSARGRGEHQPDGSLISKLGCFFGSENEKWLMQWRFEFNARTHLQTVCAGLLDGSDQENMWKEMIAHAWATVLKEAFADAKQKFFREYIFYYNGPLLDGEYWIDGFRIAPIDVKLNEPHDFFSQKAVSIQHEIEAVDNFHSFELSELTVTRFIERAALLTGMAFARPQPFRILGHLGNPESNQLFNPGIVPIAQPSATFPEKGATCKLGAFDGTVFSSTYPITVGKALTFPIETRQVFKALKETSSQIRNAFDNYCGMYRLSLLVGSASRSAGFSYKVAAIDALKTSIGAKGFKDFVNDLCPDLKQSQLVELCWQRIRSAHFHEGDLRADRMPMTRSVFTPESLAQMSLGQQVDHLFTEVKSAWLQRVLGISRSTG